MASEFKFVDTSLEGFELKRKQPPQRACDACRRKKKRCPHAAGLSESGQPLSAAPTSRAVSLDTPQHSATAQSSSTANVEQQGTVTTHDLVGEQHPTAIRDSQSNIEAHLQRIESRESGSRFIGDMNPEGILLAATTPQTQRGGPLDDVGFWLSQKYNQSNASLTQNKIKTSSNNLFYGFTPAIQQVFLPILQADCLVTLPPANYCQALCSTYFQKFHPILPMIDRKSYEVLPENTPSRILLTQAMCLAARFDPVSSPHLFISDDSELLNRREFGERISAAMRVTIEIGIVTDKTILMQALAVMSLFTEGRDDNETSSIMIGRAIQHVYSLGLHMQDNEEDPKQGYSETLFCCVWAIDRLHAAFQGKPVLIHERDIGRTMSKCFDAQKPVFRLLLYVVGLLDCVIDSYRPGNASQTLTDGLCSFEELVVKCGVAHAHTYQLATVEALYHAVAILSCRTPVGNSNTKTRSAQKTHQMLSIERITSLCDQDFFNYLVLYPFVPYAISLSLSVNYSEMRTTKIPLFRNRARIAFEANCKALGQLRHTFRSAAVMADLAQSILRELDRVYAQITDDALNEQSQNGFRVRVDDLNLVDSGHFDPTSEQDFTSTSFDGIGHFNPFEMFDPKFDLDGIDAYLEANLDLAAPIGISF